MAYYSRHSIFLYDNDKQKLLYLQTLIEEEELSFELREETVYQYDGEPLNMLCISDANFGPEIGCAWYILMMTWNASLRNSIKCTSSIG